MNGGCIYLAPTYLRGTGVPLYMLYTSKRSEETKKMVAYGLAQHAKVSVWMTNKCHDDRHHGIYRQQAGSNNLLVWKHTLLTIVMIPRLHRKPRAAVALLLHARIGPQMRKTACFDHFAWIQTFTRNWLMSAWQINVGAWNLFNVSEKHKMRLYVHIIRNLMKSYSYWLNFKYQILEENSR